MTVRKLIAVLMAVLAMGTVVGVFGAGVASAARGDVSVTATFNGQDLARASTAAPVRLEPGALARVQLEVTNDGREPIVVKRVELAGDILGLNFYRYVASTELTVDPGTTGTLMYQIDLTGLDRLATGFVRADLTVIDDAGRTITTIATVTDVQGSLWSVMGLFGFTLVVLTAIAFVQVALAVARHRLPANRAQRGLRFLLPGLGLLLVVGFTASVLRLWTPPSGVWFAALGISAAFFFGLGYFSPMPGDDDDYPADYDGFTDQFTDGFTDRFTDDFADGENTYDYADDDNTRDLAAVQRAQYAETESTDDAADPGAVGSDTAGGGDIDESGADVVAVGDSGKRAGDEAGP